MILTIIVFAAASIRKKQGSGEMRWNETSQRISGRETRVSELCVWGSKPEFQAVERGPAWFTIVGEAMTLVQWAEISAAWPRSNP